MHGKAIISVIVWCHCLVLIAADNAEVHNPIKTLRTQNVINGFPNQTFIVSDGSSFEWSISSEDIQGDGILGPVLSAKGELRNFTVAEYYAELKSVSSGKKRLRMALANLNRTKLLLDEFMHSNSTASSTLSPRAEASSQPTDSGRGNMTTTGTTIIITAPGVITFTALVIFSHVNIKENFGTSAVIAAAIAAIATAAVSRLVDALEKNGSMTAMEGQIVAIVAQVLNAIKQAADRSRQNMLRNDRAQDRNNRDRFRNVEFDSRVNLLEDGGTGMTVGSSQAFDTSPGLDTFANFADFPSVVASSSTVPSLSIVATTATAEASSSAFSAPLVGTSQDTTESPRVKLDLPRSSGEFFQAIETMQRNRTDGEVVLGPAPMPNVNKLLGKAYSLLFWLNKPDEASTLWKQALSGTNTEPITDYKTFSSIVTNLMNKYLQQERRGEAADLLDRAILRLRNQFNGNTESVPAYGLLVLGDLYFMRSIHKMFPKVSKQAENLYTEALFRASRDLGSDHSLTHKIFEHLSWLRDLMEYKNIDYDVEPVNRSAVNSAENIGTATTTLSDTFSSIL